MNDVTLPPTETVLRTLTPALRRLHDSLRSWLDTPHRFPLAETAHTALVSHTADLCRQADSLDSDQPYLVIVLMGGTGVGKSTLLNALAGSDIAQASFVRPTTRDPVVYYHESIRPDRLDPTLQRCRLVPHNREPLDHKIIIDTPDLDSNDQANREKLRELLPVADVVLYVGSQEKYHDQLGWDLFLEQRRRRAFAFVLNKWDRCLHGSGGVRPDEDLLRDLHAQGFAAPLLFRTCAQHWVKTSKAVGRDQANLPDGEQFPQLVHWLEMGLSRLEIDAIKARGVHQLLGQLQNELTLASPPDLTETARKVESVWTKTLAEEAGAVVAVLLNTLDPHQREIEHHFALEGQRRFHGLMAGYLHLITRARYFGTNVRNRFKLFPQRAATDTAPAAYDLTSFAGSLSAVAGDRHLDARGRALSNRLLLEGNQVGFPLEFLTDCLDSVTQLDWRRRYARALSDVLENIERTWTQPEGTRRWIQAVLVFVSDWLPPLVFLAACCRLLWRYFVAEARPELSDVLLPFVVLLLVLMILHLIILFLMPLRWPRIRGEFRRQLEERVRVDLESAYAPIPGQVAEELCSERRQVEQILTDLLSLATWLEQRRQAASVDALYGK